MTGQCVPYGDANVFVAIAEALRRSCEPRPTRTTSTSTTTGSTRNGRRRDRLRQRVVERVSAALEMPAETPECERMVEGMLPPHGRRHPSGSDPTRARDDSLRSTIAYFEALASKRPIVLTLSDLHWASDEALELCNRMLARLHDLPFVLVATTRPGLDERWTSGAGKHTELALHLDPLDRDSTAELVRGVVLRRADDDTVEFPASSAVVATRSSWRSSSPSCRKLATASACTSCRPRSTGSSPLASTRWSSRNDSCSKTARSSAASGSIAAVLALAARPDARRFARQPRRTRFPRMEHDEFHFKSELIRETRTARSPRPRRARRHAVVAPVAGHTGGEQTLDQTAHHLATAARNCSTSSARSTGVPDDIREQAIEALMRARRPRRSGRVVDPPPNAITVARCSCSVREHRGRRTALLGPRAAPASIAACSTRPATTR